MAWIRIKGGMLNLSRAFEISYDQAVETLTVWWAGDLPADHNEEAPAALYDTGRLGRYGVTPDEYERFARDVIANTQ